MQIKHDIYHTMLYRINLILNSEKSVRMHELSIALGIVKIAEAETAKANAKEVERIELEIGELAGVEIDSLDFVWDTAVKDSVLEKAEKHINIIKGIGKCIDCYTEFEMHYIYDTCPNCNSNLKSILKGKELRVKTLDVI
ncbi:MAG: hydrogenase maturation nickel metallochaperone HypA [Flavobacteriaceae bacterium]